MTKPKMTCMYCDREFLSERRLRAHEPYCDEQVDRMRSSLSRRPRRRIRDEDEERGEAARLEEGFEMLDEDYGS